MDTNEEQRAGELLERLGKKKSPVVVAALNEYMVDHPEILAGKGNIQFHLSAPDQQQLENTVRRLVTELLGSGAVVTGAAQDAPPPAAQKVSDDILDMLTDLDMFG